MNGKCNFHHYKISNIVNKNFTRINVILNVILIQIFLSHFRSLNRLNLTPFFSKIW